MKTFIVATLAAACGLPAVDHTPTPKPVDRTPHEQGAEVRTTGTADGRPTAMDQGSSKAETDMTARVRKALVDAPDISTAGENILVVTRGNTVSLVGDIEEAEHQRVLTAVRGVIGSHQLDDYINRADGQRAHGQQSNARTGADNRTGTTERMGEDYRTDDNGAFEQRARKVWTDDEMLRDGTRDVRVSRRDGVIHVTGTVADEATRQRVLASLDPIDDDQRVMDHLTIGASAAPGQRTDQRGKQDNMGANDTTNQQPRTGDTGAAPRTGTGTGNQSGTGTGNQAGGSSGDTSSGGAGKTGGNR